MAKVNEYRRGEDAAARLNRNLQILSRCNRALFQARGEQELLQSICQILVETAELPLVWIGYCEDDAGQTVRPVAMAGDGVDYPGPVNIFWGDLQAGQKPGGGTQPGRAKRTRHAHPAAPPSYLRTRDADSLLLP